MRILILADRVSARGGADIHLLGVVEDLVSRHDVMVAAGRHDGEVSLPCTGVVVAGLDARLDTPVDLDCLVGEWNPDVIHLHNVVNPLALEWAGGRAALLTVQDHRFFCPGRGKLTADTKVCSVAMDPEACRACFGEDRYFHEMLALTRRRLQALGGLDLVVLSQYMRRELELVGIGSDRIHVIPPFAHGLDLGQGDDVREHVLFAGRLVAAKGPRDAIAAWRGSGLELPLVVAGTGSERAGIERNIDSGVRLLGWVRHAELAALYRRAAVVVMPSRWQEPFGIVGLEALSLGAPVAAWRSGGVEEWHPGPGLVPWGDVDALADAVRSLVGTRVEAPPGYERRPLMERLETLYATIAAR